MNGYREFIAAGYALAAAIMFQSTQPSDAQEKNITLKFSHFLPPSHPLHKSAEEWLKSNPINL